MNPAPRAALVARQMAAVAAWHADRAAVVAPASCRQWLLRSEPLAAMFRFRLARGAMFWRCCCHWQDALAAC